MKKLVCENPTSVTLRVASALGVAERIKKAYQTNPDAADIVSRWRKGWNRQSLEMLEALTPTASVEEVVAATKNKSWTHPRCTCCEQYVEEAVEVSKAWSSDNVCLCGPCVTGLAKVFSNRGGKPASFAPTKPAPRKVEFPFEALHVGAVLRATDEFLCLTPGKFYRVYSAESRTSGKLEYFVTCKMSDGQAQPHKLEYTYSNAFKASSPYGSPAKVVRGFLATGKIRQKLLKHLA